MSTQTIKTALRRVNWCAVFCVLIVLLMVLREQFLLAILYVLSMILLELMSIHRTLEDANVKTLP